MLLTVDKKTYRAKTPRPQRKSFFYELGALCPSTLLRVVSLSFESLRTVSQFERSNHAFARDTVFPISFSSKISNIFG
jgi:hypothetical protein